MSASSSYAGRVLRALNFIENSLLSVLLTLMIGLACTQIVLRNLFETALLWADPLLRAMVLWLGMFGAMVASRENRHISIDVLLKFVPLVWMHRALLVSATFTSVVCALIAFHGYRFVQFEFVDRSIAFAGVPAWAVEAIIPVAFAVIALRYAAHAWRAARGRAPRDLSPHD